MSRKILLSVLVLALSLYTVLTQEAAKPKAEQQSTVNVAAGQGFSGPNEGIIDDKTGRSPLLDSIFNFFWNFGSLAGCILVIERLLRLFCSINLGIFSSNEPPTPNLPMLKKEN